MTIMARAQDSRHVAGLKTRATWQVRYRPCRAPRATPGAAFVGDANCIYSENSLSNPRRRSGSQNVSAKSNQNAQLSKRLQGAPVAFVGVCRRSFQLACCGPFVTDQSEPLSNKTTTAGSRLQGLRSSCFCPFHSQSSSPPLCVSSDIVSVREDSRFWGTKLV